MTELTTPEPTAVERAQAKLDGALETHRAIAADQEAFQLAQRAAAREMRYSANYFTGCERKKKPNSNFCGIHRRDEKPNSNFCGIHRRDYER
jgi:hypothetical protein